MPTLPTPDLSWQVDDNNAEASAAEATFYKTMLLNWKNALKAFTNGWTVVGSSNSSAAGMDGVDRWSTTANLVGVSSGAHSWIVLQDANGMQHCWDLIDTQTGSPNSVRRFTWKVSISGAFSGGSTSASPTASDSVNVFTDASGGWLQDQSGTLINHVWHMWCSADGTVTRCVVFRNNVPIVYWCSERVKNPVTLMQKGWRYLGVGTGGGSSNVMSRATAGVTVLSTRINSLSLNAGFTAMFLGRDSNVANSVFGEAFAQVQDELESGLQCFEIPLCCQTTGARGLKRGFLYDLWVGQFPPAATGDHFPNTPSATREFVQIGPFIFKWNGTPSVAGSVMLTA